MKTFRTRLIVKRWNPPAAETFRDVIALWPGVGEFADDIGTSYNTAKQMRRRNSIAPEHWPAVAAAAESRGYPEVTVEFLTRLRIARAEPAAVATVAAE